jgi:hypothetical protein
MLNSQDIYSHIANGGDPKELHKALENEIKVAQEKAIKAKAAELKKKEAEQKELKARDTAFKAIKAYVTLVNPTLDDAFIDSALDLCRTFKVVTLKDAQSPDWLVDFVRNVF